MILKEKVALVTGGAVRVGEAICRALAEQGADVIIHYRHSENEANRLCAALNASGARAFTLEMNLDSEKSCHALIESAIRLAGRLDILVNNAAVFHKDSLKTMTAQKIQDEFFPNLIAPMLLTKAFSEQGKEGKIINVLDRRIASHDTSCVPYVLSKKALAEFTQLAALALAPKFTVNAVAPGAILPPPGKGEEYLHDHAGKIPLDRRSSPEDVAKAIFFLLSQDTITGQIIFVDGGQHSLGNAV